MVNNELNAKLEFKPKIDFNNESGDRPTAEPVILEFSQGATKLLPKHFMAYMVCTRYLLKIKL